MRMRKKAHLEERLAACVRSGKLILLQSEDRNFRTSALEKEYIDFEKLFGNKNPVVMEIGCGKGLFAAEYASHHPDINVFAVEKTSNVIVDAAEKAIALDIGNLILARADANYLGRFIPPKSVSLLFLNFSCPYPKKSYALHRLTHENFLKIYDEFLCDGAEIHQKTDNQAFFEFSIEKLTGFGYALKNVSLNLHESDFGGNIMTEYEKRFSDMGLPIYRLEAYRRT